MPTLNKIFAVIDPTTDNQIALTRAGKIAGRNDDIAIHAYEAIHVSGDTARMPMRWSGLRLRAIRRGWILW